MKFFNSVDGTCVGMVVNIGDNTVMGDIAGFASGLDIKTLAGKLVENIQAHLARTVPAVLYHYN